MQTKSIFLSKTFWFNLVTFVVALAAVPDFISLLPASVLPYLPFVSVVGNMVLRTYFPSAQPLSVLGGWKEPR